MVAIPKPTLLAVEEYLKTEPHSKVKREYARGKIYAMAGASDDHVLITGNAYAMLKNHLRGKGCLTFFTDTKVRIASNEVYYYPDLVVTCDPRDRNFKDGKYFPTLIIEVLSPSTSSRDRGEKFADYRQIETLQEYVLIQQNSMQIDIFRRNAANRWELFPFEQGDIVEFASLDFQAAIAQFYEDVLFDMSS
jgi:Uma2 family endonuclease